MKFNFGRYLAPATNDTIYTPTTRAAIVTTASRSWSDLNSNYVVDCDILNPAAQTVPGGDTCGALTGNALNFGKPGGLDAGEPGPVERLGRPAGRLAVGRQPGAGAAPRVSLDVGYNRRWWGNYTVTDNTLVGPADYQKWTILAPNDRAAARRRRLPDRRVHADAAASARRADNYVTFETDYGPARTNYWHGVDLTLNARTRQG